MMRDRCVACAYPQFLYEHSIAQTDVRVRKHILALTGLVRSLASRLVVNTNNHQSLVGDCVNEVLAADLDGVDGIGDARKERGQQRERANGLLAVSLSDFAVAATDMTAG